MSQSDQHRDLVLRMTKALSLRYPRTTMVIDIQRDPGDEIPPMIGGFRPDLYATRGFGDETIIGEAKSNDDLDNEHTRKQIMSFLSFLERRENGVFVLSVTGIRADRAKTILRFIHRDIRTANVGIVVFDGCDCWSLDFSGGARWLLI